MEVVGLRNRLESSAEKALDPVANSTRLHGVEEASGLMGERTPRAIDLSMRLIASWSLPCAGPRSCNCGSGPWGPRHNGGDEEEVT